MEQEEIIELFDRFINENGLFYTFKEWVEQQGYQLSDLGIKDE